MRDVSPRPLAGEGQGGEGSTSPANPHSGTCPTASGSMMPSQIASPPPVGIGTAWIFRWPGRSTSPNGGPQRRTANAAAKHTAMLGIVAPRISQNMGNGSGIRGQGYGGKGRDKAKGEPLEVKEFARIGVRSTKYGVRRYDDSICAAVSHSLLAAPCSLPLRTAYFVLRTLQFVGLHSSLPPEPCPLDPFGHFPAPTKEILIVRQAVVGERVFVVLPAVMLVL